MERLLTIEREYKIYLLMMSKRIYLNKKYSDVYYKNLVELLRSPMDFGYSSIVGAFERAVLILNNPPFNSEISVLSYNDFISIRILERRNKSLIKIGI